MTRDELLEQADEAMRAIASEPAEIASVVTAINALRLTVAASLAEPSPEAREVFERWAEVELMGHRQRIALVREVEIGHRTFLELTCIPELRRCAECGLWHRGSTSKGSDPEAEPHDFVERTDRMVEVYSPSAVFCMTPLSGEDAALAVARGDSEDIPF